MDKVKRCEWAQEHPLLKKYHDEEWGNLNQFEDDQYLFELLILEGAQAGLSWLTILKKRENYQKAFDQFKPELVAEYDENKIEELLQNEGIIRNKLKIRSAIKNAQAFLNIQKEFGSFHQFLCDFFEGEQIINNWKDKSEIPSLTNESERLSKELKARGFNFVGPKICYAFMQATGIVVDHESQCFLSHA